VPTADSREKAGGVFSEWPPFFGPPQFVVRFRVFFRSFPSRYLSVTWWSLFPPEKVRFFYKEATLFLAALTFFCATPRGVSKRTGTACFAGSSPPPPSVAFLRRDRCPLPPRVHFYPLVMEISDLLVGLALVCHFSPPPPPLFPFLWGLLPSPFSHFFRVFVEAFSERLLFPHVSGPFFPPPPPLL